jgi:hypothetical protein
VLEDGAADHRVQSFACQAEPIHQSAQRSGEHVLVRGFGVGAIGSTEWDTVAA